MKIEGLPRTLNFSKKLFLGSAGIVAIAVPIVFGQVNATHTQDKSPQTTSSASPTIEVASIRQNRSSWDPTSAAGLRENPTGFTVAGVSTKFLIELAYDIFQDPQFVGGPNWINSERYDIQAKWTDSLAKEWKNLPPTQKEERTKLILQSLLADRFKLTVHRETRTLPIYALVVGKDGSKLHEPNPMDSRPDGFKGISSDQRGQMIGQKASLELLASTLSLHLDRAVVDETGLKGNYDFALNWTPDESEWRYAEIGQGPGNPPLTDASGPSVFTAIQEQLGLKLVPQKGPLAVLVIDHIERPSEN